LNAFEALAIFLAGGVAGAVNTVVGSGTLVTFPVLLAFGYPPLVANVSNTIGLVPGSVAGAVGYRRELAEQRRTSLLVRLAAASVIGALSGATLLLALPAGAFKPIVVIFIALALGLIVAQPRIAAHSARRGRGGLGRRPATAATFASGAYGGYFGAAQGILLLAILGLTLDDDLRRVNAVKVVLAGLVNLVAGVLFMIVAHVAWLAALLIAAGSILGGLAGARAGRRLPATAVRGLIIIVGLTAILRLIL